MAKLNNEFMLNKMKLEAEIESMKQENNRKIRQIDYEWKKIKLDAHKENNQHEFQMTKMEKESN